MKRNRKKERKGKTKGNTMGIREFPIVAYVIVIVTLMAKEINCLCFLL